MKLSCKQQLFTFMTGQLIKFAYDNGFGLTYDDAKRDVRIKYPYKVHPNSLHYLRLAVDYNVWRGNKLLNKSEDFMELGEFWESIGGAWGGRFASGDGNHFSLEHNGMK